MVASKAMIIGFGSVAAVGGLATCAKAQITGHLVGQNARYSQTADNVPAGLDGVGVSEGVFTTSAGDITSADVTVPTVPSSMFSLTQSGTQWIHFESFSSIADADSAYPNGNYVFNTAGGTVGATSDTLLFQGTQPAEGVFTGTSLQDMATMDPSGPIHITFNGFTPDPTLNLNRLSLQVVGGTAGDQSFDLDTSATDFTFPAGTFDPATLYYVTLEYFNDNLDATGQSDHSSYTSVNFTTASVPEPASLALFAAAGACLLVRRRR